MGKFIVLPGVNPDTSHPRVDLLDVLLPDAGALYLFEPGHPAADFPAGTPVNGVAIRNLAGEQAAALVGGAESAVNSTVVVGTYTAGSAILERSSKGGIHSIHSQSVAVSGGVHVPVPLPILNYLAANPTHDIYMSFWGRMTRKGNTPLSFAAIAFPVASASATELLASIGMDSSQFFPTGSNRIGFDRTPAGAWIASGTSYAAPAPLFTGGAVSQYTGTVGSNRQGKALSLRGGPMFNGNTTPADQISAILYRGYAEDLTVSGRTYATVVAADRALFDQQVVTPGGRYYGDTFTDPATLP